MGVWGLRPQRVQGGALALLPFGRRRPLDTLAGPGFTPADESLTTADEDLLELAHETLLRHYRPLWHTVAAAIRGRDGRTWTGLHLGATVGRLSICAEAIALGRAILEGDGTIDTMVAVRHPKPDEAERTPAVVSPCGACREMIMDFDPAARVILPSTAGLRRVPASLLLPSPYRR
jgi:cytidine deaminase